MSASFAFLSNPSVMVSRIQTAMPDTRRTHRNHKLGGRFVRCNDCTIVVVPTAPVHDTPIDRIAPTDVVLSNMQVLDTF
jgi:hypothetical protein